MRPRVRAIDQRSLRAILAVLVALALAWIARSLGILLVVDHAGEREASRGEAPSSFPPPRHSSSIPSTFETTTHDTVLLTDASSVTPESEERSSQQLTEYSKRAKAAQPPRKRRGCEDDTMGWPFYESLVRNRTHRICIGFSAGYCVKYPATRAYPVEEAVMCWFTNVFQIGTEERVKWVAYCKKDPEAHALMTGVSPKSVMHKGELVVVETEEELRRHLPKKHSEKPLEAIPQHHHKFLYLVSGDCYGGNPGHCRTDSDMFFIIQRLLRQKKQDSEVVFISGFIKGTLDYKQTKRGLQTPLSRTRPEDLGVKIDFSDADEFPFMFDWRLMADKIDRRISTSPGEVALVPLVGLNPNNFQGPHWRAWLHQSRVLGIPHCEGISPILSELRDTITLPGLEAIRTRPIDYDRRAKTILFHRRPHSDREITNADEVVSAIREKLGEEYTIKQIDFGEYYYVEQLALTTSAILHFGVHGGSMWNAAKVLVEDQSLVEIIPVTPGGTTCALAKMADMRTYREIVCSACRPGGRVDANVVAQTIADVLAGRLNESSKCPCDRQCY